jgi:hypothetical protein
MHSTGKAAYLHPFTKRHFVFGFPVRYDSILFISPPIRGYSRAFADNFSQALIGVFRGSCFAFFAVAKSPPKKAPEVGFRGFSAME